jgi:hypothetical protein
MADHASALRNNGYLIDVSVYCNVYAALHSSFWDTNPKMGHELGISNLGYCAVSIG